MKNQEKAMNRLVDVPNSLKKIMDIKNISLEDLSKETKISNIMLKDILEGKRVMPEYLMKILGKLSGSGYKFWKTLQSNELYDNNLEVGE